ncbi:hypothetical protein IVA94_14960 [Bradyrhizobium sp. 156]|uniref:hypothetical protein n=1 Tax=Bradyrhizobium sp. 156 TaxID=2782630 RepID=UPI001FFA1A0E|nr:hypothetical protein [Bradyrhizobium sp. 156]MCK1322169.1 hypothetical protein [Bradyrhizobium sp. 156]
MPNLGLKLGLSGGGLGTAGVSQQAAAALPAGYGYRYWVDGNGDNQLILYQDAGGNFYALYTLLP